MVDLKFTDLPGTWQHMGMALRSLDEEAFSEGIGFDGSSIRGFQEIYESDMLLMPDPTSAILDPFYEAPTISVICTVLDPITREPYTRDPRYVATKAEAHLKVDRDRRHLLLRPRGGVLRLRPRGLRPAGAHRVLRGRVRGGPLDLGPGVPAPRRGALLARLQEPLAGGLLPGPAQRHPERPARRDGQGPGGARDPHREPPPRGRRPGPGRDRPALPAAAGDGGRAAAAQVRGQEHGQAGGQDGDLHAEADLRGERLGHARAPVAVEGRRDADARRGRLRAAVAAGAALRGRPADARQGAAGLLRPDHQLLPAAGARLRGAGAAQALAAQPLGRGADPDVLAVAEGQADRVPPARPARQPVPGLLGDADGRPGRHRARARPGRADRPQPLRAAARAARRHPDGARPRSTRRSTRSRPTTRS